MFACAGASKPILFVKMTVEDLVNGITGTGLDCVGEWFC